MAIGSEGAPPLDFDPETNYCDSPLVTVNLACHSGDLKYLPRSLDSVAAQDLPHDQIQVLIIFDGDPTPDEERLIEAASADGDFQSIFLLGTGRKTGYYCLGRNQAIEHPYNFGMYQANLDADNEWLPGHLSGLLKAIRLPQGDEGWPHFVYSRREYIIDEEAAGLDSPTGPSSLYEWSPENIERLLATPHGNFIDTGDFLIGKGALYQVAEKTGCIWDTNRRRFGDWDLVCRFARAGLRGKAVDQVTHLYHWIGSNLQRTRRTSDFVVLPLEHYLRLKEQGAFKDE